MPYIKKIPDSSEREPVEIEKLFGGRVVKISTYGRLIQGSYDSFTSDLDGLLERHGKIGLIFEMFHFDGWSMGAAWEDLKFSCKHFNHIERIDIVGERKWERAMSTLLKPSTRAQVSHFDIADIDRRN